MGTANVTSRMSFTGHSLRRESCSPRIICNTVVSSIVIILFVGSFTRPIRISRRTVVGFYASHHSGCGVCTGKFPFVIRAFRSKKRLVYKCTKEGRWSGQKMPSIKLILIDRYFLSSPVFYTVFVEQGISNRKCPKCICTRTF